jgi:hypothetical protein
VSVRTSAVVAGGIALLTVIGVGAIFGESIVAFVSPPKTDATFPTAPVSARSDQTATAAPPKSSTGVAARDGGAISSSDGSS